MLTLLLVDDDADILRGLEKTVNWQQCGITKVVTAQNGLEALRITDEMPIDVMITDVKMPGMDGLKLTETLRARGSQIEVILLSGFADFEYAKTAIRYGVVGYALKPVDIEECIQLTSTAVSRCLANRSQATLQQELAFIDTALWEHTLRDAVLGRVTQGKLEEIAAKIGLVNQQYCLVSIAVLGLAQSDLDILGVRMMIGNCCPKVSVVITGEQIITAYFQQRMTVKQIRILMEEVFIELELSHGLTIRVALSGNLCELNELRISYSRTQETLRNMYMDVNLRYFEPREKSEGKGVDLQQLNCIICGGKELLTEAQLEDAFAFLSTCGGTVSSIQAAVSSLLFYIERYCVDELLHERAKELLISARQALRTNWNIDKDKATLKVLVGKLRGLETEDPASGKVALIGKIKRNIHENYSKDIDLFSVSEALMKNPNYLSHLFCEVSGQTFSEYLNSVRIEHAKLKLSQSDDTIYSIARQVGYNSERYFVTIFKKMTDLTPTQFRNRK